MNRNRAGAMLRIGRLVRCRAIAALCFALMQGGVSDACARDKGPVEIRAVNDNLTGPWQRKEVVIEGAIPTDEQDAFHYVLLLGEPIKGRYDCFKIARNPKDGACYLILGSNDGSLQWVEEGVLTGQKETGPWRFVLTRTNSAEMQSDKSAREFSWSANRREIDVRIQKWSRFFLNPVWGQPVTEHYKLTLSPSPTS